LLSFGSNDGYLEGAGQTSTATLWSEPASERLERILFAPTRSCGQGCAREFDDWFFATLRDWVQYYSPVVDMLSSSLFGRRLIGDRPPARPVIPRRSANEALVPDHHSRYERACWTIRRRRCSGTTTLTGWNRGDLDWEEKWHPFSSVDRPRCRTRDPRKFYQAD